MTNSSFGSENWSDEQRLRAFEQSFLRAHGPIPPPETCPIGWQPSALTPVFYGVREYEIADGAPTALRVFFPSLDGSVFSAPILDGCGQYPMIIFAHGHCPGDDSQYKKWFHLPAQLARSGYVVVVPNLPHISDTPSGNPSDLRTLTDVLSWIRADWEHRNLLLPSSPIGIAGHSYGALLSALFAQAPEVAAFASLSGVWEEWPSRPLPIEGLDIPMLFIMGGPEDIFTSIPEELWDKLSRPRHRAIFKHGLHWDYLPKGETPCYIPRGDCRYLSGASVDLVTMFFAKYLPTELAPDLPDHIPDDLVPPPLVLTPEQAFYAGGHLISYKLLEGKPKCDVSLDHAMPDDRTVPYVRFEPQLTAAKQVRNADLNPVFSGPTGPGVAWVQTQSPAPGTIVKVGSTVKMALRIGPIP
jgi:hypothetical protein